ncbi:peptidase [Gardnerella vaginalis]|uniref:Rib/alpha-like domain-containing protein n=1 Tax=Gardnerella vaginalis TaxID=2702 RepID=UPI00200FB7C8|nr:Rib/alpha-like domain-containing protein [Gardnerella vaginalis]UQA79946.1 peptidase [Gardnerella vaginalis]
MAKNTRQKHARNQEYRSFANVSANFSASTARKVSLSALTTVLTAATCLGGQPILASSNILLPPTTAAFAEEVRSADADPNPWLHTPNILEFQRYRYQNSNGDAGYVGDNQIGDWDSIKNKSMMYAHVEESGGNRYLVFDVFFNNDGKSMLTASKQQQYVWQVPFAVADLNNGAYKDDTVTDLRFDFYKRNERSKNTPATLSHDIGLFDHDASKSFSVGVLNNSYSHANSTFLNTLGIRAGSSKGSDIYTTFHTTGAKLDNAIKKAIALSYPYDKYSYGLGIRTTDVNYAVKLHCKVKLRPNATKDEIQNAFTWTNTSSFAKNTNSSYTFISGRTHEENFPRTKSDNIAPKLYFNGKEIGDKDNNSITVYQGESNTFTFSTSDNSEKVTKFSVGGFPNGINANFNESNKDGFDATEKKPYKHEIKDVKFEHKDGKTPVNSDYTITVSATDASGNKAEKVITVHLKNLKEKYKAPTTTPITVDWGHKPTKEELEKHVSGVNGGTLTFDSIQETNIPEQYFNGKDTLPAYASGKVTYSDGSYHNVTVPVNVKKPLSLQHKLNGNTVNATVGEDLKKVSGSNKVDAKEYLGKLDDATKKNIKSAEWVNNEPSTDVAGKREYTAKVTFNDGSTAEEKVTFTVKPKKPTIETDLTGVAGIAGKEVVVNAGPGTEGSTVTLKDNGKKVIGTGKAGADGKVTITVKDGISEGKITAVTTTTDSVSSEESDAKNASKDDQKPTLTADTAKVEVEVGKDLTINLTATDNLKVDRIDTATATMALFNNDPTKLLSDPTRAGSKYTKDTDKEKKLTYTFSGFKLEEIGTYNLTFKAFDSAGNESKPVTVKVTVKKKEDLQTRPITVDLGEKLDEKWAKKAIANSRKLPKKTKFAWAENGKPNTSTVGKEKDGTVIVTIPTNDPKNPRVETVKVKVTVKDRKEPEVTIKQMGDGGTYNTINGEYTDGPKHPPVFTINTYRGDKNDIKITATDNSGEVTTLTLTPKTPGETENAPTGTGTDKKPKTLILDGTTPLNTEPGKYKRTITAVDPSGNTTTVAVEFVVKTQAEKYSKVTGTPVTYKMSSGTTHPDPKSGINAADLNKLPKDAKYSWATEPDWNTPGKDTTAEVLITFPDGSTQKVETKVTVNDDIPPVINTPNTNKAKRADTEQAEYYQFKVHNGKQFNIDINAYDNSGKIKSATLSMPEEITGSKISITDKDNNSAEKPAKITITGTAHRANNTNPDANKWSRELSVTDEAGNTSKLKVQISVYTDAEEHDATPSPTSTPVKNPTDNNAITNAITITKKDDPSSTVDRSKLTFTVGEIPKTDGIHAVPVKITYPDGSTTTVEVPVLIKLQNKIYNPNGKTIEVPWHSNANELINKIKNVNSLTWENNKKPTTDPTVTIVGGNSSVPSTDKVGKSQVQVKVTYSDGSSDVATVTVNVLEPQNKTYTPEGKTIKVDYNTNPNNSIKNSVETNGVKLKKNGADVTLPNDAKVTIDNDNTIPNGTQPGDFTVPVTITYGDGSTDHATVTVKVGEPQNKKYEPEQPDGINVGYGNKTKPSDSDIIAKVKFDDNKQPPSGTTITVDKDQTQIDTKTPGIVNVKVTVKYPDGSEDHVEVPVTVGEPDNVTHKASATPIELHKNEAKPTEKQIKDKVKTGVSASEDQPTITLDKDTIPETTQTGTTNVPVTITYKDKTSTTVQVPVIVKDWNKDEYPPSADPVEEPYGTSKEKTKEAIKNAVTVDWPDKNDTSKPQPTVTITSDDKDIPSGTEPGTKTVKVTVTYPDTSTKEVTVDVTIKNKQSDTFEPKVTPVVKPYDTKKDEIENAIKDAVKIPDFKSKEGEKKPEISIVTGDGNTVPDGQTPGSYTVKVKITYPDKTEKVVKVPVTISSKESDAYPPKADSITKKNGEKPSEDEIKNAVKIPNWPSDKGEVKKTVDSNSIPDGNKGGTFNVPVTVTYPDKSVAKINVPVNIGNPTATAKVVTVPKGVEPKPEDSIANKDKFPKGTTFDWKKDAAPKTDKPVTTTGTVLVHIPGVKDPVKAKVTVNVNPAPTAQDTTVIQNSDPDPKNSIKDNDKLPKGTTFEWKKGAAPKTDKPGTTTGTVIVKIPGQEPQEVPVKITVTASPEGKDVTVLQKTDGKDNTPQPKDVIKNNSDLPENAKTSWKKKPDTSKTGNQPGIVTVKVPGEPDVDIPVNVLVVPNPAGKTVSVHVGDSPSAENSIANKDELPNGTKFAWATNGTPDTKTAGNNKSGTVVVTIPGIANPVNVPVTVNVVAQNKPFINGGKAENTPDKSDKTTITGKTQPGNTVTVKDNDGNTVGTGDANKDGNFTIEIDKKDPGTTLKLVPNKGGVDGDATTVIVTAKPQKPTITVPTDNQKNDGNVTVTPPTGDTTVVKIEINAKPNSINGPEQPVRTIIAKKDNDGKWKIDGDAPDGVTVDPKTGVVTIPAKNLEDGSTITAVSKNKTDKPSDPATAVTGFKTPQISEQKLKDNPDDSTKQIITGKTLPGATVTVTDKDGKQIGTGVADKNGNFTITINKQTPGAIVNLTPTNGTGDFAKTGNTVEVTVGGDIAVPRIDTPADGSATITPNLTDTRIDKVVITYTPEGDGSTPQTVTITVIAEGDKRVWKIDGDAPEGVTVDPKTGVVTIPAANVKDGSKITAFAKNSADSSSTVTGTIAQPGDGGSGDSGDDSGSGESGESGSHANNANNANNANKNGSNASNANNANKNGSNNHGNQSRNSGSNSGSRRGKGALGNTGVGVALSALASAMLAGMGAAGRAVSRRKKRN